MSVERKYELKIFNMLKKEIRVRSLDKSTNKISHPANLPPKVIGL